MDGPGIDGRKISGPCEQTHTIHLNVKFVKAGSYRSRWISKCVEWVLPTIRKVHHRENIKFVHRVP